MKYLLLTLLLGSCSLLKYPVKRNFDPQVQTHADKLEKCIFRLIERNGISAKDAGSICISIHRRS